ncbi:MAG: hypothetical protein OXF41_10575 [bacterium]|nr:hypothetical protein [bacterium]
MGDNPLIWISPAAIVTVALVGAMVKWLIRIGSMNEHKRTVTGFTVEIRDDIKKIMRRLPAEPVGMTSPLALTDYGKKLSAKLDAVMWAKQEADSLRDQDTGTEPFEIEEFSFEHVRRTYPQIRDLSITIRTAVYEHGINRDHVYSVLEVVLRDELIRRVGAERV